MAISTDKTTENRSSQDNNFVERVNNPPRRLDTISDVEEENTSSNSIPNTPERSELSLNTAIGFNPPEVDNFRQPDEKELREMSQKMKNKFNNIKSQTIEKFYHTAFWLYIQHEESQAKKYKFKYNEQNVKQKLWCLLTHMLEKKMLQSEWLQHLLLDKVMIEPDTIEYESKVQFLFNHNKNSENEDEEEEKEVPISELSTALQSTNVSSKPKLAKQFKIVQNISNTEHVGYLYKILLQFLQKQQKPNVEGNDLLLQTSILKVDNLFKHFVRQSSLAKKATPNDRKIAKIKNISILWMRLLENLGVIEIDEPNNQVREHLDKILIYREKFQKDPGNSSKEVSLALENFMKPPIS